MHDEIKISWLQNQLHSEKQQRLMEALEYKLEGKLGEVSKKVDQIFQYVEKSVDELKQQQKLLINRQDQLFNKQDQIQSTLAEDSVSVILSNDDLDKCADANTNTFRDKVWWSSGYTWRMSTTFITTHTQDDDATIYIRHGVL